MDETQSRPRGRPSPEAKARRAQPRTRPRHKPNERDERGFVRYLRPHDQVADYATWRARFALYSALPRAAPREFLQLAEAASSTWPPHPLFGFGQAVIEWCQRFKPENGKWPDWFLRDAMRSYEIWNPDDSPFFITPTMTRNPHLDRIEAEAVVWCKMVRVEEDPDGRARPRVLERGEIMEELKTRFAELISPDLDLALKTAVELGVSGAEQGTLDDDMRRFVLKQFRRLKTREIAAAEAGGDSWVDCERFDPHELEAVNQSDERKINLSIGRAAKALGIRPRRHRSGPEPAQQV